MSRQFALAAIIALAATAAQAGGVASISEADITTNGDQAYTDACETRDREFEKQ